MSIRLIAVAMLLAGLVSSHWAVYVRGKDSGRAEVQTKFDAYKGNINDQVQKAKSDAAIEKQRQDAKYNKANSDYAAAARDLAAALKRLRNTEAVPGNAGVPLAGGGTSDVPAEATDPARTAEAAPLAAGACAGTEFWKAAVADTLQCSALIEFVK